MCRWNDDKKKFLFSSGDLDLYLIVVQLQKRTLRLSSHCDTYNLKIYIMDCAKKQKLLASFLHFFLPMNFFGISATQYWIIRKILWHFRSHLIVLNSQRNYLHTTLVIKNILGLVWEEMISKYCCDNSKNMSEIHS